MFFWGCKCLISFLFDTISSLPTQYITLEQIGIVVHIYVLIPRGPWNVSKQDVIPWSATWRTQTRETITDIRILKHIIIEFRLLKVCYTNNIKSRLPAGILDRFLFAIRRANLQGWKYCLVVILQMRSYLAGTLNNPTGIPVTLHNLLLHETSTIRQEASTSSNLSRLVVPFWS